MKDGRKRDDLYSVWREMNRRCYSPNCCNYHKYGAKGIKVCQEWLRKCDGGEDGYKHFLEWATIAGYKKGLSLDRKNPYKDYTPENCQWVSSKEQNSKLVIMKKNTSGYVGVGKDKYEGKWRARIMKKTIGSFKSKKEALEARNKYIIEHNLSEPIQEWIGEQGYTSETYRAVFENQECDAYIDKIKG